VEKVFTISITNVNEAPTDIALSPLSIAENQPAGTTVGTFSTTDPDVGDSHTYMLVSGTGSTDNGSFSIDASGHLKTAASFDFETKNSYSIRVRSTDAGGLYVEKVFTISITNVNEAPTIAVPAAQTAYEDVDKTISGITVGDPDGDRLTVTLSVGHGTLTLGTTTGLTITGNGTGAVSLSGSIANLNAALASLIYRGSLNYGGDDTLSITASDGSLSAQPASVAIHVKSAAEQAADLQAQVSALQSAGVLNQGQANSLNVKLNLQGNVGDIGRVQAFLNEVAADLNAGILTQSQADVLSYWGNILLLSVTRR
jgi:VCBS repeat-containing protein